MVRKSARIMVGKEEVLRFELRCQPCEANVDLLDKLISVVYQDAHEQKHDSDAIVLAIKPDVNSEGNIVGWHLFQVGLSLVPIVKEFISTRCAKMLSSPEEHE